MIHDAFMSLPNLTPEDDEPGYCRCVVDEPRRNVLVDINDGRICVIACANCEYPILFGDMVDDFEHVYANGLSVVMTTSVEQESEHRGLGMYEDVDVRFHELSAHEGDE